MKTNSAGFTLIELMFTLAIAAILMGVAAPNMKEAAMNSRMVAKHNELANALQLARSEAIKRSSNVSVCARLTDTKCGTDWNQGWLVFTDQGATRGTIDSGEQVLGISPALTGSLTLTNSARIAGGSGQTAGRPFVRFTSRGGSNWRGGGTFVLCDDEGERAPKALNIIMSGDVRKATKNGSGSLVNAFGTGITCSQQTSA